MQFKDMVGKVIVGVEHAGGELVLSIKDARDSKEEPVEVRLTAEGDCCSSGWVGACQVPDLPAKVLECKEGYLQRDVETVEDTLTEIPTVHAYGEDRPAVNDGPCPRSYAATQQCGDCLSVYGFRIETDCGPLRCDIWNDSNGYYGSSVELS